MMTYRDLLKIEHPDALDKSYYGGCCGCPGNYWDGAPHRDNCGRNPSPMNCTHCWYSEVPNSIPAPRVQFNINEMQKGEKEMEPRMFNDMASKPVTEALKPMNVCEAMKKLYETLIEIEGLAEGTNMVLFGDARADSFAGEPTCLESNVHAALDMANMIREELLRLRSGLMG